MKILPHICWLEHLTLTVPWYDVWTQWWSLHLALLEPCENIVGVQAPSNTPFLFWWRVEVPHTMLCPWWWCWDVPRWWIFHHELEFKPRLPSESLPYINHSRAPNEEWCRLSYSNLAFLFPQICVLHCCMERQVMRSLYPKLLSTKVGCWYGSTEVPNLGLIPQQTLTAPQVGVFFLPAYTLLRFEMVSTRLSLKSLRGPCTTLQLAGILKWVSMGNSLRRIRTGASWKGKQ